MRTKDEIPRILDEKRVPCNISLPVSLKKIVKANNLNLSAFVESALTDLFSGEQKSPQGIRFHKTEIAPYNVRAIRTIDEQNMPNNEDCLRAFSHSSIFLQSSKCTENEGILLNNDIFYNISKYGENCVENLFFSQFFAPIVSLINYKNQHVSMVTENVSENIKQTQIVLTAENFIEALKQFSTIGNCIQPVITTPPLTTIKSIADIVLEYKETYYKVMAERMTSRVRMDDYYKSIRKLTFIYTPHDITNYSTERKGLPEALKSALRKLLDMLYFNLGIKEINNYPIAEWKENISHCRNSAISHPKQPKQRKTTSTELQKYYETAGKNLSEKDEKKAKILFALCFYSGARFAQLIEALSMPKEKKNIRIGSNFCVLDVKHIGAGSKHTYSYYFPLKCLKYVEKTFKMPVKSNGCKYTMSGYRNYFEADIDGKHYTSSVLRKFQYNALLDLKKDMISCDLIQSRIVKSLNTNPVSIEHYLDVDGLCDSVYSESVDYLLELLPFEFE